MANEGKWQFLAGLFLICMCGLMMQIIETRILSVVAYYYLAFFAIGMAMFGMTAGSLFVYFKEELFPRDRLLENLVWISALFSVAIVGSALLTISTVISGNAVGFLMTALEWGKLIIILAAPYFFAGMAISLALTRSPWPVALVYGVDLVGAACGCLVVLAVMTFMDSVSALFLVGALGALAAGLFAQAQRARNEVKTPLLPVANLRILKRPLMLAVGFAVLAIGNALVQPHGFRLAMVKDEIEVLAPDSKILWNSFSRINVDPSERRQPQLWGASPKTPAYEGEQRHMAIDGSAASAMYRFDGDLSKLGFLKYDITNLAYTIRQSGRAAVIGVGGGRDLLSAEYFGFRDVTGVELNPIFVDLLTHSLKDYNRLASLPGVRLFVDDGRSWFARSPENFDLIQMSMVDTWAATGAGAYSLSENGLYTVEGWRTFFRHLTPTSIFTVSRWYSPTNIDETGRMMSVAVAALLEEGISNPKDHLFLAANGNLATLIVSRAPFPAGELAALTAKVDDLGFKVIAAPRAQAATPVLAEILDARAPDTLFQLSSKYLLDLSPASDARPFFFQQIRLSDVRSYLYALKSEDGVVRGNLRAMSTLALITLIALVLVIEAMLIPSLPSVRRVSLGLAGYGSAYFLLIGLGFMFVEIGLIQRISVYLGHPVYGLAIGLFGIILSSGIGSLVSARMPLLRGGQILAWSALLGAYLVALPYWLPHLIELFASSSLPVRALVSLSAIMPLGILMGFGFPTGMQLVNNSDTRPTSWFWAVNGAAGVLASSLAVIISIDFSISTTIWCGAACYVLLGPVAVLLGKPGGIRNLNVSYPVAQSAAE
jgi:hypothetical protein